jgi:hypothetical protein
MRKRETKAYRPRPPFKIIEGVGTAPFKRLDPFAQYVLLRFYEKFNGHNRSDLSLTYGEVSPIMSSTIFSRSIWQLIGFGFLDVRRWGRLERNASLYGLSDRWRRFCEPGSETQLDKIAAQLKEVENLKRQKWPEGKKSEKRERVAALRHSLFTVKEPLIYG